MKWTTISLLFLVISLPVLYDVAIKALLFLLAIIVAIRVPAGRTGECLLISSRSSILSVVISWVCSP